MPNRRRNGVGVANQYPICPTRSLILSSLLLSSHPHEVLCFPRGLPNAVLSPILGHPLSIESLGKLLRQSRLARTLDPDKNNALDKVGTYARFHELPKGERMLANLRSRNGDRQTGEIHAPVATTHGRRIPLAVKLGSEHHIRPMPKNFDRPPSPRLWLIRFIVRGHDNGKAWVNLT